MRELSNRLADGVSLGAGIASAEGRHQQCGMIVLFERTNQAKHASTVDSSRFRHGIISFDIRIVMRDAVFEQGKSLCEIFNPHRLLANDDTQR